MDISCRHEGFCCYCCLEQKCLGFFFFSVYKFHLKIIIILGTYSLPLHICLCAPVVFLNACWERPSRLHLCPCVIELKWAWFMLGPTEFPSWPLLLQAFQLVYTTRLERTAAESSLCPQNIPPRCLGWVQTDFVVDDGVTWSVPPPPFCSLHRPCWFPVVQVAVVVLSCSQLHFTFSSFFTSLLRDWWSIFKRPKKEVELCFTLPEMKTNAHRQQMRFWNKQCLWAAPQRSTS